MCPFFISLDEALKNPMKDAIHSVYKYARTNTHKQAGGDCMVQIELQGRARGCTKTGGLELSFNLSACAVHEFRWPQTTTFLVDGRASQVKCPFQLCSCHLDHFCVFFLSSITLELWEDELRQSDYFSLTMFYRVWNWSWVEDQGPEGLKGRRKGERICTCPEDNCTRSTLAPPLAPTSTITAATWQKRRKIIIWKRLLLLLLLYRPLDLLCYRGLRSASHSWILEHRLEKDHFESSSSLSSLSLGASSPVWRVTWVCRLRLTAGKRIPFKSVKAIGPWGSSLR